MAARTVYACEVCQVLRAPSDLPPDRIKALAAAQPTQVGPGTGLDQIDTDTAVPCT